MKDWQAGDKKLSRRIDEIDESNVTSVNTQTGAVVLDAGDVGALPVGGTAADSELLDGIDSTSFIRNDIADAQSLGGRLTVGTLGTDPNEGGEIAFQKPTNSTFTQNGYIDIYQDRFRMITFGGGVTRAIDFPTVTGEVWTSGNDGAGTGLDADTVDSLEASQLLRSDVTDTAAGKITFNGGLDVLGGLNNSISLEYGKHHINSNDGGGNFNIRIGNHFTTGCTEVGYAFHEEWSQSAGYQRFRISTASLAVNDTPTWKDILKLSVNQIVTQGVMLPKAHAVDDIGSTTYRYRYGYFQYLNISAGASTRSDDTIFYSSNDSFIRVNNKQGMRAALEVVADNLIVNGNFSVNQISNAAIIGGGTTAAGFYVCDQWRCTSLGTGAYAEWYDGASGGNYSNRFYIYGANGNTEVTANQRIESMVTESDLAGGSVTATIRLYSSLAKNYFIALYYPTAVDNWAGRTWIETHTVAHPGDTGGGVFREFSVTFNNLPNGVVNGLELSIVPESGLQLNQSMGLDTVKLEKGDTFTGWNVIDMANELTACQRFWQRHSPTANAKKYMNQATTDVDVMQSTFLTPMRIAPTATIAFSPSTTWRLSALYLWATTDNWQLRGTTNGVGEYYISSDGTFDFDARL